MRFQNSTVKPNYANYRSVDLYDFYVRVLPLFSFRKKSERPISSYQLTCVFKNLWPNLSHRFSTTKFHGRSATEFRRNATTKVARLHTRIFDRRLRTDFSELACARITRILSRIIVFSTPSAPAKSSPPNNHRHVIAKLRGASERFLQNSSKYGRTDFVTRPRNWVTKSNRLCSSYAVFFLVLFVHRCSLLSQQKSECPSNPVERFERIVNIVEIYTRRSTSYN